MKEGQEPFKRLATVRARGLIRRCSSTSDKRALAAGLETRAMVKLAAATSGSRAQRVKGRANCPRRKESPVVSMIRAAVSPRLMRIKARIRGWITLVSKR
jgi:hypothetical protein